MSQPRHLRWSFLIVLSVLIAIVFVVSYPWYISSQIRLAFDQGMSAFYRNDLGDLMISIEKLDGHSEFESKHHLLRGLLLMRQQLSREAMHEFGEALGDVDTTALALTYSGQILHFAKDHLGAERMLLAAIEADPKLVEPHRLLSAAYYDIGAMDNALQHLAKVIELAPDDVRPWRLRGLILKDFEKYDEAVNSYHGALERTKDVQLLPEIREELAECLVQLRRYQEAIDQLKQLKPTAESKSLETDALLALGRVEEAEASLAEATQLDSSNLRVMTIRSTLLMERGELQNAKQQLELAVASHPYEFNLRSLLMQVMLRMGDKEGAKVQESKSKELRELKDRFAKLHIDSINNPTDSNLRFELGITASQLGMREVAIGWYQATLGMNPSHIEARKQLFQLQQLSDNPNKTPDQKN
ncbi:MAG TPA: tetratricopeptide repeat protein [Pirellula sp.]|nr:tetratricopeptide repeat protein [Pirellula sp.]